MIYPKTTLEYENIVLKKLELRHAEDIYNLRQDRDVIKFLPNKYHKSVKKTEEYIRNNLVKWNNKKTLNYVVILDNQVAGVIMLSKLDFKNKNCELGIWLGKKFWGKGIAKKSINLLLNYAFNELNMHRIYFLINENNSSSIKLFEKIGAQREGLLRKSRYISGQFEDKLIYSILKGEFK